MVFVLAYADPLPLILSVCHGPRDDDVGPELLDAESGNARFELAGYVVDAGEVGDVQGVGICEAGDGLVAELFFAGGTAMDFAGVGGGDAEEAEGVFDAEEVLE